MKGTILDYNPQNQNGLIAGEDGKRYVGGVLKCMLINGGQTKSNGDTVYLRCGSSKYHLLSPLPWAEYKAKRQIRQ